MRAPWYREPHAKARLECWDRGERFQAIAWIFVNDDVGKGESGPGKKGETHLIKGNPAAERRLQGPANSAAEWGGVDIRSNQPGGGDSQRGDQKETPNITKNCLSQTSCVRQNRNTPVIHTRNFTPSVGDG